MGKLRTILSDIEKPPFDDHYSNQYRNPESNIKVLENADSLLKASRIFQNTSSQLDEQRFLKSKLQMELLRESSGWRFMAYQEGRRGLVQYIHSLEAYYVDLKYRADLALEKILEARNEQEEASSLANKEANIKVAAIEKTSNDRIEILDQQTIGKDKALEACKKEIAMLERIRGDLFNRLYPGYPSEKTAKKLFCPLTGLAMGNAIMLPDDSHINAASLGLSVINGKIQIDSTILLNEKDYNLEELSRVFRELFFEVVDPNKCIELLKDRTYLNELLEVVLPILIIDYSVSDLARAYSPREGSIEQLRFQPIREEWMRDIISSDFFDKPVTLQCGHSFSKRSLKKAKDCMRPTCQCPIEITSSNKILRAFVDKFLLLPLSLEQMIEEIELEMRQIKNVTLCYEDALLELKDAFARTKDLTVESSHEDDPHGLQQKEAMIQDAQKMLIEVEAKLPPLKDLYKLWAHHLQNVKDAKEEKSEKEEDEREDFWRSFCINPSNNKKETESLMISLQESIKKDWVKKSNEQAKAKQAKNEIYQAVSQTHAVLEAQKKVEEARSFRDNLLKTLEDHDQRLQNELQRLKELDSYPLHYFARDFAQIELKVLFEASDKESQRQGELDSHPLRHFSRDLVQMELKASLESRDKVGREKLKTYIEDELSGAIESTIRKRRDAASKFIDTNIHADVTTRTYFCGVTALETLGQIYNYKPDIASLREKIIYHLP